MLYRPERVLLLGIAAYLAIFLIAPVTPIVSLRISAIAFIFLCCAAFLAGSWMAGLIGMRTYRNVCSEGWLRKQASRLFLGTFALGLLGNLLKLYDTYYLRGSGSIDAFELRAALSDVSAGPLSALGGALYPFGFIPLLLYLGSRDIDRSPLRLVLATGLFIFPALDALMLLSRSALIIAFAMIYFGLALTIYSGRAFPNALRWPALILVASLATLSAIVFQMRLEGMKLDAINSMYTSAYGFTVQPSAWAQMQMQDGDSALSQILNSVIPLFQYYVHSLLEWQLLWERRSIQIHSFGLLLFDPYVKGLGIFGWADQVDIFSLFPRVGVFTTFFGPLWVDFGWFAPLVMILFGYVSRRLGRAAQAGDVGALPFYTFICVVLFLAPVANFLLSKGMYAINAFIMFWIISRPYARACSGRVRRGQAAKMPAVQSRGAIS
jgi:hypothetical protein